MGDMTRYELQQWDDGRFSEREESGWHTLATFDTPEAAEAGRRDALLVARSLLRIEPTAGPK